MSTIDLLDMTILLLCTLFMSLALTKWLVHKENAVINITAWYILFPAYIGTILFGIVNLFATNPVLISGRDFTLTLFTHIGIPFSILVIILEQKWRESLNINEHKDDSPVEG